jgi:hypothetical protein
MESDYTTKGDILVAIAPSTPARLTVGATDGHVLTVDAASAAGVKWAEATSALQNLALNPSFEVVLGGTHTVAITRNDGNETVNTQFPGWQTYSTNASDEITVARTTTGISSMHSTYAMSIAAGNVTATPKVRQVWSTAEYLQQLVAAVKGSYLTFALDVNQSAATANACRLFITYDGTGGTTVYSSYHGANTDLERLFVQTTDVIPSDCTTISFGIEFASTTPTYYVDNAAVIGSANVLTTLPYKPRVPTALNALIPNATQIMQYTTPADTSYHVTGDGTADVDYSINANRPAWATAVRLTLLASNGTAAQSAQIRPNNVDSRPSYISGLADTWNEAIVSIGEDGQIQFSVSATGVDLLLLLAAWIGDNI